MERLVIFRIVFRHLLRARQFLRRKVSVNLILFAADIDLFHPCLQSLQLALLDYKRLVIQILDNVVMLLLVDLQDDGFD